MKTTELKAQARESVGKKTNKSLRKEGRVPGVIYHNDQATHLDFDYKELKSLLYSRDTYIVNLDIDGKISNAIVREAQYHPVSEKILHVDFMELTDDKAVILMLPVNLIGTPVGVTTGGKLVTKLRKIKVKGIPSKLPEKIDINVESLELGETIKISDANIDIEGLQIITNLSTGVASVEIPRALRSSGMEGEEGEEGVEGEETAAAAE